MPSTVLIRRARHDEGAVVADVHTRSWQETYERDLPPEALAAMRVDPAEWAKRIAEAGRVDSTTSIWVAELDDQIVGFAACGPDPDADQGPADSKDKKVGQLYSIYVLRVAQGTGVGRRLHTQVLDALRQAGFTAATLWVLRSNAPAIRFYEIADWRADGASRTEQRGGVTLHEVRYRRSLGRTTDDY